MSRFADVQRFVRTVRGGDQPTNDDEPATPPRLTQRQLSFNDIINDAG